MRDQAIDEHDGLTLRDTTMLIKAMLRDGAGLLYRRRIGSDAATQIPVPHLSAHQAFGFPRVALMQPGFFASRIPPEDAAAVEAARQRCHDTGEAVVEYRFLDASGETRWLRDQLTKLDRADADSEFVVYVTDITDEYMVRLRLQQSERMVTLGLLTTNIAHEINQPLAAIGMAAQNGLRALDFCIREAGSDDPAIRAKLVTAQDQARSKLERIIAQTSRIADVISHIRRFGKFDDDARPETVHLADIVEEALVLSEPRMVTAGVTAVLDVAAELPTLRTMRVPLEQVLVNIIVNACDAYGPSASTAVDAADRKVWISARRDRDGLRLLLADAAGGVPAHLITRIFDPFFTTKEAGAGTGIGLFVSMISINELGGTLMARNEARGAVFDIWLPCIPAAAR